MASDCKKMPISEEQRRRAEANRQTALEKRKSITQSLDDMQMHQATNPWSLFKCRKLTRAAIPAFHPSAPSAAAQYKFLAWLEIFSPDSFSITPKAFPGFTYPGDEECFKNLRNCLSNVLLSHYTQNNGGGKACVYNIRDYDSILSCLKNEKNIEIQNIPFGTLNVIQRLSVSFVSGKWAPCRPEHLTEEKVNELIEMLPKKLLDTLMPFQHDGLRFGLQRGGRCLIADEMGLGKTLQAIAIAGCFMNEGSILVVCPAILRFSWAEELERWLPSCLPSEIHLVFSHQNNPTHLTRCPRVVVISFKMLHHLRKSITKQEWALLIVDESHHIRCSKKRSDPEEIKVVLDLASMVKRVVLLSGTPSLSRPFDIFHQINILWPGLLGQNKYDFAKTYCDVKFVQTSDGKCFQDFSRGVRLEELNVLLRQTVMIRRLKEHVLQQLPPKRRQIIRLLLKRSDIISAKASVRLSTCDSLEIDAPQGSNSDNFNDCANDNGCSVKSRNLSYQELGIAKLSGFCEWFSVHSPISDSTGVTGVDVQSSSQKMIVFAHHHKVLNGVQEFICDRGFNFIRIDGNTLPRDRQSAVLSFQSSNEVKIAIIGLTAGGLGLDFSSAQNVAFLELPQSPSLMLQAEDRAHRHGQINAVNIYIFCAKDTMDESHWKYLNKSLHRVSSATNGKYDAVAHIPVDGVSYLKTTSLENGSSSESYGPSAELEFSSGELRKISDFHMSMPTTNSFDALEPSLVLDMEMDGYFGASNGDTERLIRNEIGNERCSFSATSSGENISEGQLQKDESFCHVAAEMGPKVTVAEDEVKNCSKLLYSLRFEVSRYTGRVHLYSCILGTESRPRPLFENFRLEELELLSSGMDNDEHKPAVKFLNEYPFHRSALIAFFNEWNKLRPIERRKLVGKPLQLPLTTELCYLNECTNHNRVGLLKGGSKRRTTPLHEISHPLPSGAVWKMVNLSACHGKQQKQYAQGWTLLGEPLCKLCQSPCKGSCVDAPEYFEDLFCNLSCYEEYRMRTSKSCLRHELFQIEHGVCTNCQLDCHKLVKILRPLPLEKRRVYVERWAPKVASRAKLLNKLILDPCEGNAWHADHIVPVYRGGGECRLENMRTLCVACHYDVTAAQRAERWLAKEKAKKQLKVIMANLRHDWNTQECSTVVQGLEKSKAQHQMGEDELLLVKVPGSSYSAFDLSENDGHDLALEDNQDQP